MQAFLQQEESIFLTTVFVGAIVLGSPIQGPMVLLRFPVILGAAASINGVFENVFPAAGAALADRTGGR